LIAYGPIDVEDAQGVSRCLRHAVRDPTGRLALQISQGAGSIRGVELVEQRTKAGLSHAAARGCTLGPVS
jgi:hypothetical protein